MLFGLSSLIDTGLLLKIEQHPICYSYYWKSTTKIILHNTWHHFINVLTPPFIDRFEDFRCQRISFRLKLSNNLLMPLLYYKGHLQCFFSARLTIKFAFNSVLKDLLIVNNNLFTIKIRFFPHLRCQITLTSTQDASGSNFIFLWIWGLMLKTEEGSDYPQGELQWGGTRFVQGFPLVT